MDIIDKLRRQAAHDMAAGTLYSHIVDNEAADEIEFLREQLAKETKNKKEFERDLTKAAWQVSAMLMRERYKKAFQKMRNVAAGYSNLCDDSGSTRRLEREFTEAEEMFSALENE